MDFALSQLPEFKFESYPYHYSRFVWRIKGLGFDLPVILRKFLCRRAGQTV